MANPANAGIPPEYLTAQLAGIWSGWNGLGDREIVREASAKGTHIELAHKFLEQRRHCSLQEARDFFFNEVEIWLSTLLTRKQIHRASHILKNVGKNPTDYIKTFCLKCKETDLRNYLAHHVESSFSNDEKAAWILIQLLAKREQEVGQNDLISHKCLEEIINTPQSIKDALYTEIYFYCYEPEIVAYLKNTVLWDYLLTNNRVDLIKLWIDLSFGESDSLLFGDEHRSDIRLLFTNLKITDDMVSSVEISNGMDHTKNIVLNYLSRYGIFSDKERDDVKLILRRFFEQCVPVSEFQKILSRPFCNIDRNNFNLKVLELHLSRYYCENTEKKALDLKNRKLYESLEKLTKAEENFEHHLEQGIIETINYLSNDFSQYLKINPIVSFTLVLLHVLKVGRISNNEKLKDILANQCELKTESFSISKDVLDSTLHQLPFLKYELESKSIKNSITMYQLLDGFKNLNCKTFFKWRLKNGAMPDFSNESLVRKFGHKEKLSFINFLKEARPNMAANFFQKQEEKLIGGISSKAKCQASLCAHIFALRHLKDIEILCGCISFLEILGVDSENLRLHITVARFVEEELDVSIGSLLESSIFNNQEDLRTVLNYLERAFHSRLDIQILNDSESFFRTLSLWDVVVKFAKIHRAPLPLSMLKFLASYDAWLEFALVSHIFRYSIEQVVDCIQHFDSCSMREHLILALRNDDLLKEFLSVEHENHSDEIANEKNSNRVSIEQGANNKDLSSETLVLDRTGKHSVVSSSKIIDDLWHIILNCHQSQDPPGALLKASRKFRLPILTLLATCFEPSSTLSYCFTWLTISADTADFTKEYEQYLDSQIWSAITVMNLFQNLVCHGFVTTLKRGLHIFLPDNPLNLFFSSLNECLESGNFKSCQESLEKFIADCNNYRCNKIIDWDSSDASYLENVNWIQTVVVRCVMVALDKALRSTRARIDYLNVLIESEFDKKLAVNVPNFNILLECTKILSGTQVVLDFLSFDTTQETCKSEEEIEKCINELIYLEDYSSALRLSKITNSNASKVKLAQYRSEFKKSADKNGQVESLFWSRCASDFKMYEVNYEKSAEFFVEHAEKVRSNQERFEILKLALEILKENSTDRRTCDTVEMAMWKSCILAGPDNIEIKPQETVFRKLKTELLSNISDLKVSCPLTGPEEESAVELLIGRLLDAGKLDTALRIGTIFNHRNKNLQILMLCLSLAEGEITPYQLTPQQRSLLAESEKQRIRNNTLLSLKRLPSTSSLNLSASNANTSSISESINATAIVEQQEQLDCLSLLTNLVEILNRGVEIGIRILLCYRLSIQLGKSYQVLLTLSDPMHLLQEIVASSYDRKLEIAKDVITSYQIENKRLAHFLAEEIVAHITQVIEDGLNDPTTASNYNMNLQSVIELCKDSSLLGLKLLDMAHKLLGHSNGEKRNLVTLKIIVELLIRSHDCFTASCNMEGIASVLRKCQQLANSLQNLKHWSLLVRLITGVGRFTEMNYIFQILKEHDQFETLLGRGMDKVPGLRMALLDFLKRNCPEDGDLFNIVALHFRLYYEIALVWKNEAKDVINLLVKDARKECGRTLFNANVEIKFTKNETTEMRLKLILANLTHATQYFLQDNKLNLANRSSQQAQLIALQICLFQNTPISGGQFPCLLQLSSEEVNRAISRHLSFPQALILARAYDHHVDWSSALYSHCLVGGNSRYLREFLASKKLTAALVADCARRYRLEKNASTVMNDGMRSLLMGLDDVRAKYVLASQLGFKDIVETLLDEPIKGGFLRDAAFNRRSDLESFLSET
ncbi:hypothetical protein QAD02_000265 [Eretmocerus hayati]|uniref:Uncharacterized protein n=1 Tax=Eretmocerus hayati TaxID=131215 RepID=A0ACC2ND35_9HYME|nr:hypothetical protein QAD02_000265 [Eretmocerus hayati]